MNRRSFLQALGAFAASAFIPLAGERIVRAPSWWKGKVHVYRAARPLAAGNYTFSAFAGQEYGLYVGGVKALGGEQYFEIPKSEDYDLTNPRLSTNGITIAPNGGYYDFTNTETFDALVRGEKVEKA